MLRLHQEEHQYEGEQGNLYLQLHLHILIDQDDDIFLLFV